VIRFRHASPIEDAQVIRLRGIRIHPGRREVLAGKTSVALTPSEFSLLHMLAQRPGWVFTRAQIINTLHGNDNIVNVRSVDYLVSGLKKKLGAQSGSIESVRGYGYRVAPEASMPGPN
jgi:two-component system phosphate regulon response regulator PhoB